MEARKKHVLVKSTEGKEGLAGLKLWSKSKLYVQDMSECEAYGCVCLLGPAKARCTSAISRFFFSFSRTLNKKRKKIKPSCFFPFTLAFQEKLMKSFFSPFIPAIRRHGSRRDVCRRVSVKLEKMVLIQRC